MSSLRAMASEEPRYRGLDLVIDSARAPAGVPSPPTITVLARGMASAAVLLADDRRVLVRVILATTGGLRNATKLRELLPDPFLPENLS
jgi:hypothetical protein